MSGHSKWHNIQMKKGKTDAARGKIFTKIGREIAIAVRAGGPDPALNSKLRDIISKAKYNNMPNDNINRSIKVKTTRKSPTRDTARPAPRSSSSASRITSTVPRPMCATALKSTADPWVRPAAFPGCSTARA